MFRRRPSLLDPIMSKSRIFSPGDEEKQMQMGHLVQPTLILRKHVKWLVRSYSTSQQLNQN